MTQPPDLAERLLRWSLADDERDAVLGDMQEEFAVIARVSPARAARWYWSQAAWSIGPNLARRVRKQTAEARRLESDDDRRSRLKARKWGFALLVGTFGSALGSVQPGFSREPSQLYFAVVGIVLFVGSFVPLSIDRGAAGIRARRWLLFFVGYWLSLLPEMLLGHTPLVMRIEWVSVFAGCTLLFWPETYWIFGFTPVAPLAPQVRTPFIGLRRAPDGSLSLTMSAPEAPASLADPIVVRAGDSRIAIDRVFSNSDALRVFTLVGEGVRRPRVELDILDSSGNVRRSASPRPDPAELVIGNAPVRQPNVAISKIDASISLRDLPAGRYLLRLTAVDSTHRSDKYAEFTIRD